MLSVVAMAQVPREAVEFTRMVVRAFYPPEFVVLTDAVLRHNNYCAHHDLARRLRIQPKELRQMLVRMVHARLMCNEKRQQKRINLKDERRPTRTVNTEFWYVPLAEIVDVFSYRVHKLSKEFETRRANELAQQKYVCSNCKTAYALLEILSEMTPNGDFICVKMGVRPDRRPRPCGGIIREEDNTTQVRETERIIQKLEKELRPLRARADQCSRMEIPAHPLDGADEKTWGEIVPETVGIHGEAVDEEGLDKELSSKLNDKDDDKGDAIPGLDQSLAIPGPAKDDGVIPERPSWFKDSNRDADDMEDDWVDEHGVGQNVLNSKTGTAASFAEEDDEKYYERYLKELGEPVVPSVSAKPPSGRKRAASGVPLSAPVAEPDVIVLEDEPAAQTQPTRAAASAAPKEAPAGDDLGDAVVYVAGKQMKLSEVTEDMTEKMTADEYEAYYALAQGGTGGGDDDDDDDFE